MTASRIKSKQIETNPSSCHAHIPLFFFFFFRPLPTPPLNEAVPEMCLRTKAKGDSCQEAANKVKMNKNGIETNKSKHKH